MNISEMIAAAKAKTATTEKKPVIVPINPVVDKLLAEQVCISYKEAGAIAKLAGANTWHGGIKFLSQQGLGADAQLLVMKNGAMPNTRNQNRLTQFGYPTTGYTEVDHVALLEILEAMAADKAESKWFANA